jgi:hypothetical protein
VSLDFRATIPFAAMNICHVSPSYGDAGLGAAASVFAPGQPELSVLHERVSNQSYRMPPIGSTLIDDEGAALIASWISSVQTCN